MSSIRVVFNGVSKAIAELLWFCFATLCDWFKKLAPPSQPDRCKTKSNRNSVTCVSRRLGFCYMHLLQALIIGSFCCLRLLWLAIVIGLVLVLQHSIKNRSSKMLKLSLVSLAFSLRVLLEKRLLTVGTTVMKNCDPLVLGPALAMLTVYGRSCLKFRWNSSSNSPPQIDSPPVPSPEK